MLAGQNNLEYLASFNMLTIISQIEKTRNNNDLAKEYEEEEEGEEDDVDDEEDDDDCPHQVLS